MRDAGVGESPQADPLGAGDFMHAFYWMKPPGESDGSSDPQFIVPNKDGKSFDPVCGGFGSPKTNMFPGRVDGNGGHEGEINGATVEPFDCERLLALGIYNPLFTCDEGRPVDAADNEYAPHAGAWFHNQYKNLINNSYPRLGEKAEYPGYTD